MEGANAGLLTFNMGRQLQPLSTRCRDYWYNGIMNPGTAPSVVGHVKNGVVVFDAQVPLREGQEVRVEPIVQVDSNVDKDSTTRLRELEQLFAKWTEEDGELSEEQADQLHVALQENRGLGFHDPALVLCQSSADG
jgi:hypothetical protein